MTKLRKVVVQGFRSFGPHPTSLDFDAPIAVIWGANSQGKTSLAEAIEFLFTGDIARRQLLSSALDEFENSLRNAHLPTGTPTFVEATVETQKGTHFVVRRTLVEDFTKRKTCTSALALNGAPVSQQALASLGVTISGPPLGAPILMQHTLGYLFSANPKERASYFKSVLEVTDLDTIRESVREVDQRVAQAQSNYLAKLANAIIHLPIIGAIVTPLSVGTFQFANVHTKDEIASLISASVATLLLAERISPAPTLPQQLEQLEHVLGVKQAKTFPILGFKRAIQAVEWSRPEPTAWESIHSLTTKLHAQDHEANKLTALFEQLMKLTSVSTAQEDLNCPVCEAPVSLTKARLQKIREHLQSTDEFRAVAKKAKAALDSLFSSVLTLEKAAFSACPEFFQWSRAKRIQEGFRTPRLAQLLDSSHHPALERWFRTTARFLVRRKRLLRNVQTVKDRIEKAREDITQIAITPSLSELWNSLEAASKLLVAAVEDYKSEVDPLTQPLKESVSAKSQTSGYAELLSVGQHIPELRIEILDGAARKMLSEELQQACEQIESAKEVVLESKFDALSDEMRKWWNWMRPDEAAFFSDLGLRENAQRTIDFTAGLAPASDRRNPKLRNAVAVFSQSQMHCLGLATFFARRCSGGHFVVLDDPIIAIDDDYSVHFITGVIRELITRGIQVIILTYNQKTWREIENRYDNGKCEAFQLHLNSPLEGTTILKSSDTLAAMLKAAEPFATSSLLEHRKDGCKRMRDCAERFCKTLLVRHRQQQGDGTAMISDYSGQNGTLGTLVPLVTPYLRPDEPGKLRAIGDGTNPGNHDDDVPTKEAIRVFLGDLKAMKKVHFT